MSNNRVLPKFIDQSWHLDKPDLEEVSSVMHEFLSGCFKEFSVSIVQCPDLTRFPYSLAAPGLCGDTQVIEYGNYKYFNNPLQNMPIFWDFTNLISQCTGNDSFAIGGGVYNGIPRKEIITNLIQSERSGTYYENHCVFLNEENRITSEYLINCNPFRNLYGSFYVCNGEQNDVLKLYARHSYKTDAQILNMMRQALCCRYFKAFVGLSGLLTLNNGTVEVAVTPRTFPQTQLTETTNIYNLEHKYNMSTPLIIHSTMFNFHELDIKMNEERLHDVFCSIKGINSRVLRGSELIGSRFLKSITPSTMEYSGYFNVVSKIHRVGAQLLRRNFD